MQNDADGYHPLSKICTAWIGKINKALKHKEPWQEIANECESFFSAATGFLWDPKYKNKFWNEDNGAVQPKFKLTIARAFELVALFGPTLYWRNPNRVAEVRSFPDLDPMAFGDIQNDPQVQQVFQSSQMEYQQETSARRCRADLMGRYLNWTPNTLKLHLHAELAITQALISGRGLLWTEPYMPPGSKKVIVGSFFDPVENLLIDPDSESILDAWWIARKCVEPVWKVERDRNLKPGSLKKYATLESANTQGESSVDSLADHHRMTGQSQDLIVYWKVWSRCGLARLNELKSELKEQLDKVVGDYVYLEVADQCPFPLNMPSDAIQSADNEAVSKAFSWPIPFWRRDRWPVQHLDFYQRPKKPWPIAPLSPGLGELKAINVLFSHLVNRVWMSMRDFIVFSRTASEEIKQIIEEGRDLSYLPLEAVNQSINEVIQFLQQPPVNQDAYKILDYLLQMFDRRVGLSDLLYGLQEKQSRSAADVRIREQMVNIRPEHMATKVEEWMSQVAKAEAFATRWFVTGEDVADLLGKTGSYLWDRYIVQEDVERTIDEIDYRVEAGSARRPNRERDQQNMQDFLQVFAPLMSQFAQLTGDSSTLNALMQRWGKTMEMDLTNLQIAAPPPPPSPEQQAQMQQQQMQQQMQAQQQQQQAQLQMEQMKLQMQASLKQQEMSTAAQIKQQESQSELAQAAQEFALKMQQLQQEGAIKIGQAAQTADLEQQRMRAQLAMQRELHALDVSAQQQQMTMEQKQAQAKLQAQKKSDELKVQAAKKMAAARPRPQTTGTPR